MEFNKVSAFFLKRHLCTNVFCKNQVYILNVNQCTICLMSEESREIKQCFPSSLSPPHQLVGHFRGGVGSNCLSLKMHKLSKSFARIFNIDLSV